MSALIPMVHIIFSVLAVDFRGSEALHLVLFSNVQYIQYLSYKQKPSELPKTAMSLQSKQERMR